MWNTVLLHSHGSVSQGPSTRVKISNLSLHCLSMCDAPLYSKEGDEDHVWQFHTLFLLLVFCVCSSLSRNDLFSQTKSLTDCSFSYLSEILLNLNFVPRLNFSQAALLHWRTIWIQFHVEKSSLRLIYLSPPSLEKFNQVLSQGELDFLLHNVIAFSLWFSSLSYFHQG